jgi:hypothetical protein
MTVATEITAGVGVRGGYLFPLDDDGLPSIQVTTAVPQQGTLLFGIKTATSSDPAPQRFNHYGMDRVFAADTLPPTEAGTVTVTLAAGNLIVDAMAEGNKVRFSGNSTWRAGNSDKRGNEPILGGMFYRQALDTEPGSATFGKKRQWNIRFYPAARWTPASNPFEAGLTDKTIAGTPTPTGQTLWGENYTESSWGNSYAEYTEGNSNYQPRVNWHLGNGTLTAFQLSHPPFSADELLVFVDGTLTTPSAVNTSTSNPSFTLTSAAGTNGKKIIELIFTNVPGNS